MSLTSALEVLKTLRRDGEIVITSMGTAREWMKLGSHPLDFVFAPSAMGQATSLALGVALAQPEKHVIVCNGDGSMLMNLGSLVTITAQGPPNLTVMVFDNGVYEVTGGQLTPGAAEVRCDDSDVDFAAIARSCGFASIFSFDGLDELEHDLRGALDAAGPTFVSLKVAAMPEAGPPTPTQPGAERAAAFRAAFCEA
jgi:phosphonopyruvate decarboxylase